jgi:hypothetical protein
MVLSFSAKLKLAARRTGRAIGRPMNPLSPDVLTVQKYHGTERRVGLFQQQWQTRRIFSRTLARFFTICGAKPPFSLCHQRRHFSRTLPTFSMLCCGKRWFNSLHWNHYAEDHQGLRRGFHADDRGVKRTLRLLCFPIARFSRLRGTRRSVTFRFRTASTPIRRREGNMPEPRRRFDKLNADAPHSRWVGRTQINHSASEFFVGFCISKRQQLVNVHRRAQGYQRTVCVHDESLGCLRSHLVIR